VTRSRPPSPHGPEAGDPAPDAELFDVAGRDRLLSGVWAAQPAVLVFLRYFGCPYCQAHVVRLRRDEDRIREAGATVVLIGQGEPRHAEQFAGTRPVPFTLLVDPDHRAYRAYGLGTGDLTQIFAPSSAVPFLTNNLRAETRQRGLRGGKFLQMPGTFVVDTSGIVRMAHRNRRIADSPSTNALLAGVADALAPDAASGRGASS